MAPKRKERESLESLLARPWCYYCDRDFDDLAVLTNHQKAKHYHCIVGTCNRRLNTIGGLKVHMDQVHKETLESVPNALPDRQGLWPEIFAMEGIPQSMLEQRTSQVIREYSKLESDWRAKTGNPLSGTQAAREASSEQAKKRQKLTVDKEEIKRRREAALAARALKQKEKEMNEQSGVGGDKLEPVQRTSSPAPDGTTSEPEPAFGSLASSQPQETTPQPARPSLAHQTPTAQSVSPYAAPAAGVSLSSTPARLATVAPPASASPLYFPPGMPQSTTPAPPTHAAAPASASPYQYQSSISPYGYPMGVASHSPAPMLGYDVPPAGLPAGVPFHPTAAMGMVSHSPVPTIASSAPPTGLGLPSHSPIPASGSGASAPGLSASVNVALPGMNALPSIPGLPARPPMDTAQVAAHTQRMTSSDLDASTLPEHQKSLASHPRSLDSRPTIEAGTKLVYSDNTLTPEEKRSASSRYRRAAKASTTQTVGHTQAATGVVDTY